MGRPRTLRSRPTNDTRQPIPAEPRVITAFTTLLRDVTHLYSRPYEDASALAPRHPGVDPAKLRVLVRAAEAVFLEVVAYYAPPRREAKR